MQKVLKVVVSVKVTSFCEVKMSMNQKQNGASVKLHAYMDPGAAAFLSYLSPQNIFQLTKPALSKTLQNA